ncbi:hypothetical protein CARUB_v10018439mg [Capsella rubella]|uniref:AAA-type ATPase N-terminal domain-containing protein n=1 Tax=Capsella rubella TaxID=81985 RepID=R0HIU9_9BRAS|nr:hypothetical protein CARUB_v10018439mg [Capsella rubella]
MLETGTIWGLTSTTMASLMFFWSMYRQFVPYQIHGFLEKYFYKMIGLVSYTVDIKFTEYTVTDDRGIFKKSQAYDAIRNYLSSKSTARAKRLKANESRNSKSLVFSLDDHEEVEDVFQGVKMKWSSSVNTSQSNRRSGSEEGRYLTLSFHNRYREMITTSYLDHVMRVGKEIGLEKRERKLYTNNSNSYCSSVDGRWKSVPFNHPATFETLAMDPEKKRLRKI